MNKEGFCKKKKKKFENENFASMRRTRGEIVNFLELNS